MKIADTGLFDEIFTHLLPDGQRHYNVTKLIAYLDAHPDAAEKVVLDVDTEHASYCLQERGVEPDRIAKLIQEPERAIKPILFIAMEDGTHLLVDGTHRYVLHYSMKVPKIRALIVPWAVGKDFLITDHPVLDKDDVMSWSGISVLRELFPEKGRPE